MAFHEVAPVNVLFLWRGSLNEGFLYRSSAGLFVFLVRCTIGIGLNRVSLAGGRLPLMLLRYEWDDMGTGMGVAVWPG
jgi:hypothetical protein